MLRLIDSLFDQVAQRLAENMCSNMYLAEQNREARHWEEVSDHAYHYSGSKYDLGEYQSIEYTPISVVRRVSYESSIFVA